MASHDDDDQLLPETEAAPLCGVKRQTLQLWRQRDRGPPFIKVEGAVRYSRRALKVWLAERTVHPGATRTAEARS